MRGWNANKDTDNYNIRSLCVHELKLHIIGIAETHLTDNNSLYLEGYQWFGNNRKNIHVRAKTGSGGVGFFIKADLLNYFNVSILDDTSEGVLWLKLDHKFENVSLIPCVCYLPPENSSRRMDVHMYFDSILTNIYKYQDFISGVDDVEHRNVADFKTNYYGDVLIDFICAF